MQILIYTIGGLVLTAIIVRGIIAFIGDATKTRKNSTTRRSK